MLYAYFTMVRLYPTKPPTTSPKPPSIERHAGNACVPLAQRYHLHFYY